MEGHEDLLGLETQPPPSADQQRRDGGTPAIPTEDDTEELKIDETKPWHLSNYLGEFDKVKVTPWRTINTLVLVSFGIVKTIAAYDGNPSVNAWDMALGLIWATVSYWCTILEAECPSLVPWLFDVDIKAILFLPVLVTVGSWCFLPWVSVVGNAGGLLFWVAATGLYFLAIFLRRRIRVNFSVTGRLPSLPVSYNDWNALRLFHQSDQTSIWLRLALVFIVGFLRLTGALILTYFPLNWSFAWAVPLYIASGVSLGLLSVYVVLCIALTVRRCFRHWRRRSSGPRGLGGDVEMASPGPPRGVAHNHTD
ncbi:hypothetical protein FA13DRAFT_1741756 [Coprinellus micaceus]|uniref:Transmembrane protein n=1 Tax=Coprinellus micaceus TaxID=71717 RepID=A0A4Y7SHZ8_COPMI|nr:hypothetical protein FA13DRAFT_1741756 [Coprinellus micaceus]